MHVRAHVRECNDVAVSVTITLLLVAASTFAGTVDAIAGGGGLVTVPALLVAGLPEPLALGTNKGQSVWGSLSAMIAFWRADRIDRRQALFAFPLGFAGAIVGARLVLLIDRDALRPIVIALLVGAAALLVLRKPSRDADDPSRRRPLVAAALALVIGAYDGFFGPGTGTFLIVGFVALCGRSLLHASADAKVVNFASNLASVLVFARAGTIEWAIALPMAAGQLVGGMIGARLALRGGARLVRVVVLVVSGALVAKLAFDLLR
jgi:uncharacterized membrane protein YfcA